MTKVYILILCKDDWKEWIFVSEIISYLLLYSKLSWNVAAYYNIHFLSHTFSEDQESKSTLAGWFLFKVSWNCSQAVDWGFGCLKAWPGLKDVFLRYLTLMVVVTRLQFLAMWTSSGALLMIWWLVSCSEWSKRETERAIQQKPQCLII